MKQLMAVVAALVILGIAGPLTIARASGCIGCDGFYVDNQPTIANGDVVMPDIQVPVTVQTVRPAPRRIIIVATPSHISSGGTSIWDALAACESGGNWADTSGGFEGGIQFLRSTWIAAGGRKYAEHAYQATREQQIEIAQGWLRQTSWKQWPACSRKLGLQ